MLQDRTGTGTGTLRHWLLICVHVMNICASVVICLNYIEGLRINETLVISKLFQIFFRYFLLDNWYTFSLKNNLIFLFWFFFVNAYAQLALPSSFYVADHHSSVTIVKCCFVNFSFFFELIGWTINFRIKKFEHLVLIYQMWSMQEM